MPSIGSLTITLEGDAADLDETLTGAEKKVKGFGRNLGGIGKKIAGGLALGTAGGVTLLGAGVAKLGLQSLSTAQDIESATAQMQSALGVTEDVAQSLAQTGVEVFENNFGASIGEASAAVALTAQQLKNIEFDELGVATENAFRMADAFGTDLDQSLNSANVLMTQFGLSQQEAFDFMSAGFQRGLNSSGDFLDSISEYGNLFGQSGATAGEFFSIMETGLQGGVLGTDKAADAFKEFQIRFLEGGDDMQAAIESLTGDGWGMFMDEIKAGDETVLGAFSLFNSLLAGIEDPIQQNAIGVALMGTQFEDMGAQAVAGIDTAATSMDDLAGSTQTLDAQYDTLTAKFETLSRGLQTSLAPVGELLVESLTTALPHIETLTNYLVETGVPAIMDAFSAMQTGFAFFEENETFSRISDSFTRIGEALGLISSDSESAGEALVTFESIMGTLETGVQAGVLIIEGIALTLEAGADAAESMAAAFVSIQDGLSGLSVSSTLDSIVASLKEGASWIPSWTPLFGQSPSPLAIGIQTAGDAARHFPDLESSLGIGGLDAVTGIADGDLEPQARGGNGGQPIIIQNILDGKIISEFIANDLGVKRANRAQFGGATAL